METRPKKVARDPTKLTGREMFVNNEALNESDLEFLKSGEIIRLVIVCVCVWGGGGGIKGSFGFIGE